MSQKLGLEEALDIAMDAELRAQAFYALSAVLPLSIAAALGLSLIPEYFAGPRFAAVRALYYGWLGTLAGALVLSFLG